MIVVTGGAGFIGANIVEQLNSRGIDDIVVVDNLSNGDKFQNLQDLAIADYIDKDDFMARLSGLGRINAIFHQGACSDTMEQDGRYMMKNNFEYSVDLLRYCHTSAVPFIYASSASVYGSGPEFVEDPARESALNVYAYSKLLFDRYVRRYLMAAEKQTQVVGLRYFNVYGPREQHKGRMASVAHHFRRQFLEEGHVRLFEGSDGYANGEQRRDFVWVGDAVKANLYFFENPDIDGVYNVGTGRSQSFNEMAVAVVNQCRSTASDLKTLVDENVIRYIPFPERLRGKYQSFTQADTSALRGAGFEEPFADVEQGVELYARSVK